MNLGKMTGTFFKMVFFKTAANAINKKIKILYLTYYILYPQAWRKLIAAYRCVDVGLVTCGLTACTPGSAMGPTLGNEYGKPLPFLHSTKFVS